jgi:hypothetical protein
MPRKRIGPAVVLGDAVRDRRPLWVFCEVCCHNAEVDPAALARRLGYDYPIPDLKARMRCSRCGSRQVDVRVKHASPGVVARHEPGE